MKKEIHELKNVITNYDVLVFDIWGVLYDGEELYPDTIKFLNKAIDLGKKIIFLSNTPRPSSIMSGKFVNWGFDMNKVNIYTSGDALREQLIAWNDEVFSKLGKCFYHLGEDNNKDILSGLSVQTTTDLEQANFLLITSFLEEAEQLDKYDSILKRAAELKLEAICPNPDLVVHQSNGIRYCAGTFAKRYENFGGIVHYYGKPETRFFNSMFNKHIKNIDISKVLMIGDTMDTDIFGAQNAGIDTALVLTGNGQEVQSILEQNQNLSNFYSFEPTWITRGVKL